MHRRQNGRGLDDADCADTPDAARNLHRSAFREFPPYLDRALGPALILADELVDHLLEVVIIIEMDLHLVAKHEEYLVVEMIFQ